MDLQSMSDRDHPGRADYISTGFRAGNRTGVPECQAN